MKKFILISFVLVMAVFVLSSCNNTDNTDAKEGFYPGTVKVGHLVALDMGPLFVAKESGFFDAEGIDVETVFFSNPGDNNAALAGGSIKFSTNPLTLAHTKLR